MLCRTEGIVIRSRDYGEADLIVTFLTPDYGLLHAFAKSPRKTRSRFGSSLEPLTYSRISLMGKEHARLPRLVQSDIIRTFQPIRESFERFEKVAEVLELLLRCSPERDASVQMFRFLLCALASVEEGSASPLLMIALKIKLLGIAGFAPKLRGCARCGAAATLFHFDEGAVLCERCTTRSVHVRRLMPGTIRMYDSLLGWSIERIHRIRSGERLVEELTSVVESHIKYYISKGCHMEPARQGAQAT